MLKIVPYDREQHASFCSLPYTKLILNSYGEVSMCCHQNIQLGKITPETNLLDIWNSPLAKEIRAESDAGRMHKVCCSSGTCPYLTKGLFPYSFQIAQNLSHPLYLEICLPDKHCNVGGETPTRENPACLMCKRNFYVPHQEDITDLLCEKAKPLMPHLRTLCVLGIAEPFWKDAVFNIFEKLDFQQHRNHIEFYTHTNGICLNEKMAHRFLQTTLSSNLAWSIDAATASTHKKIRRLDTYDLVVKNLKQWLEIARGYGAGHHSYIYNNINILNVHEMTAMVEMAVEAGVTQMVMLPTYNQSGLTPLGDLLINEKNVHVFRQNSQNAMQRAHELGLNLHYSHSFEAVPLQTQ